MITDDGEWVDLEVNVNRLLDCFGRFYEIGVFGGIIYESLQNSIDADATLVFYDFDCSSNTLIIEDNGKGMDARDIQKYYHAIAESSKDIVGERTRYGIGTKVYVMASETVETYSRKEDQPVVSTVWRKNPPGMRFCSAFEENVLSFNNGTKIILRNILDEHLPKDKRGNVTHKIIMEKIHKIIYDYYYWTIINLRQVKNFDVKYRNDYINIQPIDKTLLVPNVGTEGKWFIEKYVSVEGREYRIRGVIFYLLKGSKSKSGLKFTTDEKLGILNRKTCRGFNLPNELYDRIGGFISCPYLGPVQLPNRNGFNTKHPIWIKHEKYISRILQPLIDEVITYRKTRLTEEENKLLFNVKRNLKDVLKKLQEYQIEAGVGLKGTKEEGYFQTGKDDTISIDGLVGERGKTERKYIEKHIRPQKMGSTRSDGTKKRAPRIKGMPNFTFVKDKTKPAAYTRGSGLICINKFHPTFKRFENTSKQLKVWYIIELIATELTNTLHIPEDYHEDIDSVKNFIIRKRKDFSEELSKKLFSSLRNIRVDNF